MVKKDSPETLGTAMCRLCGEKSKIKGDNLNGAYLKFILPHMKKCGKNKSYISELIDWVQEDQRHENVPA